MPSGKKMMIMSILTIPLWLIIALFLYGSPLSKLENDSDQLLGINRHTTNSIAECRKTGKRLNQHFWKEVDLQKLNIPAALNNISLNLKVKPNTVLVDDVEVHYKAIKPTNPEVMSVSVLLLHGQAYSSDTWKKLGTIQLLGALGFHTIAVDLPGFGHSKEANIKDKGTFLANLIDALNLKKPIVISPSMSGSFSLPYILNHWQKVGGYIPVSPVGTNILDKNVCEGNAEADVKILDKTCEGLRSYLKSPAVDMSCIQIPVMVVFGEQDRGPSSARLCYLPWSQGVQIPKGRHAAYLDDPELWHKLLYNFVFLVNATDICR